MWECEDWQNFKTNEKIKKQIRTNFPCKRPLSTESLLETLKDGSLYSYIQGDLAVSDELEAKPAIISFLLELGLQIIKIPLCTVFSSKTI